MKSSTSGLGLSCYSLCGFLPILVKGVFEQCLKTLLSCKKGKDSKNTHTAFNNSPPLTFKNLDVTINLSQNQTLKETGSFPICENKLFQSEFMKLFQS